MRGLVTAAGQPVAAATVEVEGIAKHVTSSERGEYWRLLARGTYRSVLLYIYTITPITTKIIC